MDNGTPENLNDLNRRLDRAIPPHATAVGDADADPLVRAAQRVAQGPAVTLSDAAVGRIEARLFERMESMPLRPAVVSEPHSRSRWPRLALRYATVAALSLVLILMSVAQASASSLPGERLYPVKRAIEDVRLALVSADDEAALRVNLAERRIDEFESLLERGQIHLETLEDANNELTQALDLLDQGDGDWADVDLQMRGIAEREAVLLDQAGRHAGESENARLDTVSAAAVRVQQRIEASAPSNTPGQHGNGPDSTLTDSQTATPTASPTLTVTPTRTPQGMSTQHGGQSGSGGSSGNGNGTPAAPGSSNPDQGGGSQSGGSGASGGSGK